MALDIISPHIYKLVGAVNACLILDSHLKICLSFCV